MKINSQEQISQYFLTAARAAFACAVFLIPFRLRLVIWHRPFFPVYSDYTNFLLFASDIAILYVLVFWSGSLIIFPRTLKSGAVIVFIGLLGLTLASWVSVLGSVDAILSRYQAGRVVVLFLLYLFVVNEIKSVNWVLVPVAAQTFFQSVIVIFQGMSQHSLGLQTYGELILDPAKSGTSVIMADGIRFLRGYGLSDHPNIIGGCISFGLVLLLAAFLHGKTTVRMISAIIFLPCFFALVLTFSRSAWLSFFVAAIFMVGVEAVSRRWDSVKRAAVLGMLSLLLIMPFVQKNESLFISRVNAGDVARDAPMMERAFLMDAGNTLFVEHSAIGVGIGTAPLAMKMRFEFFPLNFQPPHYAILAVAMETGVLGGIFYSLAMAAPFFVFISSWNKLSKQPLLIGTVALLLAITLVGFFDYYTWSYPYGRAWQWLGWGLYSAALETTT